MGIGNDYLNTINILNDDSYFKFKKGIWKNIRKKSSFIKRMITKNNSIEKNLFGAVKLLFKENIR